MNQEIQFIFGFFKVKKLSVHAGIKNRHAFFKRLKKNLKMEIAFCTNIHNFIQS